MPLAFFGRGRERWRASNRHRGGPPARPAGGFAFAAARRKDMMTTLGVTERPARAGGEERSVTQEERLSKRDTLRAEIVKLEESIRSLLEQEEDLLRECNHTYAGGKSALVGGRVKVCVHCGRSVQGKDEKLWG